MPGPCRAPFSFPSLFTANCNTNIGLRVPRFERTTSVVARGTAVRGRCVPFLTRTPPSSNRQRSDKNIKQSGSDKLQTDAHKHWASIRGSSGDVAVYLILRRDATIKRTKNKEIPLARVHMATGRTRGQPTCRRPMATTGRGSLALGLSKAPPLISSSSSSSPQIMIRIVLLPPSTFHL